MEVALAAPAGPVEMEVAPGAGGEHAGTVDGVGNFDPALLSTDIKVTFLLLNEARYRMIDRLFGVPRDQANLVTLIGALVLAQTVRDKTERLLRGPGGPTRGDVLLGGAVLKELLQGVAGPTSGDTPLFGTLVAIAVLGGLAGPAARRSARGIRAFSHEMRLSFNHRYGRLIGSGRPAPAALPQSASAVAG